MRRIKHNLKGQAVLEYAGLIGLVVLALFAFSMRGYLRNAISSRMRKGVTDTFGKEQYYRSDTNIELNLSLEETLSVEGGNP